MGIGDTFQLLEENAFVPTPCDPLGFVPQGNKTGHVDVLAWMRQYLIATYCNILFKIFKEDRLAGRVDWNRSLEDDVVRIASERLSDALKKQLAKTFIPGNVLLHIDGKHNDQKALAHSIRASNGDKDKRAFYNSMAKVKTLMGPFYGRNIPKPRSRTTGNTRDDDDDTPTDGRVPYSARHNVFHRSTKDKIVKIRKTMKALWKKAHPMDDNIKKVTCAALNNLGHNVHSCRGEADVCISTQGGEIYSFSGDSDFLYHPIHTFVRKDPKDPTTMLAYPTQEARTSFNLTPAGMAALAVVSRNDYSVHVRGYSLKKNLKVLQSINGAKPSDAIHLSSEVLVTRYCRAVSKPWEIINPTRFSSAMDIFVHHQETFNNRPVPSSTMSFDHDMRIFEEVCDNYLRHFRNPALRGPVSLDNLPLSFFTPSVYTRNRDRTDLEDIRTEWLEVQKRLRLQNRTALIAPTLVLAPAPVPVVPALTMPVIPRRIPPVESRPGVYSSVMPFVQRPAISNLTMPVIPRRIPPVESRPGVYPSPFPAKTLPLIMPVIAPRIEPVGLLALETLYPHRHFYHVDWPRLPISVSDFPRDPHYRPHKGWMSSNKYRIRNYTIPSGPSPSADDDDADQHQSQKKKKKKKKGGIRMNKKQKTEEEKLKEEAVKREKAAARRRPDTSKKGRTEPNPNATPKNDDPATILDRVLKGKYALNVLEVGTVGQRLKDSIAFHCRKNLPEVRERIFNDLNDFFLALVKIATDVVHAARIALSCYIAKVMLEFPATTQAEIIARKNKLQDIGDIGGKHWFGSVLNVIFRWDQARTGNQVVREIVDDYRALCAQAGLVHDRWTDLISGGMNFFLQQVGGDMESIIQGHFRGNIKELVERVKTTNPTWCQGEGAPLLNDMYINPTNPKNDKHMFRNYGIVAAFWTLNAHLPSHRRFAMFPKYKHKDLYVTITEKHIMETLPFRPNTSPSTLEFLAPFTVRSVIAHPGELVYRLFMTSTVGYKTTSCLMNPSQSGPDFPPFFLPPSVDGDDFQDAYDALQSEYEIRGNHGATPAFSQAKRNFIAAIDKAIMEAKDVRSAINDDDQNKERHRRMHILHGSIQTNGLDAKLHAFHTAQKKHLAGTYGPKTTKSLLGDIKTKYPSRDELLRDHLSPEVYRIVAMDPGLANTITAVILDSRSPNRVRNLAISSGSQKEPERHHRRGLNAAKSKRGINFLENSIVPVEFPQFRNTGDDWVNWLCLRDSIRLNCVSELGVYKRLRAFYGSIMFKVKNRSLKLAQNATLNKAVGVIIRSCGIKGKWREGDNRVRPLFVAGDGNFTSRPGRPIRHLQFFKKLKTKLVALGYVIVSADEYFTSKSCCQCHTKSEDHITMERRSIQCTQCNRVRDRDHNGAHNMARAALKWMTVFSWPQELCRPTPSPQPQP
ncbi:hypothetical protein KI688_008249 [Linnemannia hyalina]|uniref:Cas12f1-like TNB domain-containing protein n=1 Tax=Linnemannia hyalina TaxID=64524 RepID=A0A9P7Y0G2_9FUNG|nr:hypothetical protein KI688_008249 [Linnemannia hyalina]